MPGDRQRGGAHNFWFSWERGNVHVTSFSTEHDYSTGSPMWKFIDALPKNINVGLVTFDGLKLHPKSRVLFAWVKNEEELQRLCKAVSAQFGEEGNRSNANAAAKENR